VSYEVAKQTLRKWREEHVRRSEEVVELWEHVLSRNDVSLKDELWAVLEQVVIAALDSSRHDVAIDCLQVLNNQFPKSTRVTKLQALRLEALGKHEDACRLYDNLLEADETSTVFRKRKIASLVAQGLRVDAIRELDEYLFTFVNDSEAWAELGELYLQEMDYMRGIFCFEELLLAFPHNGAILCRIGELRYTQGGTENIEQARQYFEKAIKLNVGQRALYGLILCCNALLVKCVSTKKRELVNAAQEAADALTSIYQNEADLKSRCYEMQMKVVNSLKMQFN